MTGALLRLLHERPEEIDLETFGSFERSSPVLEKEVDFEIADFFDRTAGVFLKELVQLKAESRVIHDQCAHIQTAFVLHP